VGIRTTTLRLWLPALACAAVVLWVGSRDAFWSDYGVEAWPAYFALRTDGVHDFLRLMPAYGGFVSFVGAPLSLLGGGLDTSFRLQALPGLLALAALAVALAAGNRRHAVLAIGLAAGSPVAYMALAAGHPEDVLAAAAAVGAVLFARNGRATAAGVLLAVAVVAKQTAVLAILPAAFALPRPRWRTVAIPVATGALVYGSLLLLHRNVHGSGLAAGAFFHPWQVWWPLGVPSDPAWEAAGHGATTSPAWLAPIPHPLIVALAVPLSALWYWRAGPARPREDAFALLALLALERCLLDPWNLGYYHLPLVLALLAWECLQRRMPVITLATTAAIWFTFRTFELREGMAPLFMYLAWTLPLGAVLVRTLYLRPAPAARLVPAPA
jgi:hypothetical protein